MSTHTPGPWTVRSWDDRSHYIREIWARDFEDFMGDSIGRIEDARLAAAAPDLLDALRRILRHIRADAGGASMSDDIYRARRAIARATNTMGNNE